MTPDTQDRHIAPEAPRLPPRRRWLGWALVGSLCLNLMLIGTIGGAMLRHGGGDHPSPAGMDPFTLMRMMRHLPEEQRDAARAILHEHRPMFEALHPARAAARAAIVEGVEAEPFDRAALRGALASARTAQAQGRAVIDDAFAEFMTRLPPEARRSLAQDIRESRYRRDKDREHGDDHGPR